jgi:hypothetical protein
VDRLVGEQLARNGLLASSKMLLEQTQLSALVDTQALEEAAPIVAAVERGLQSFHAS